MTQHAKIEVESKEGRAFLRRVAKQNMSSNMNEEWRVLASPATDWKLVFRRTIRAKRIGDFDQDIEVETDCLVSLPSKVGREVQPFHDAKPVFVMTPSYLHFNGNSGIVAKLLADGFRLEVTASAGSSNSSRHGISTYSVNAVNRQLGFYGLQIGTETVAMNGHVLIMGAVGVN